ncbi:MAG: putative toxin-antitoxin system toxin component, PIN family [Deltaproteobacteria bacterium]|nr:putative toxin-antitoxin system toxin component, PIN family [Deltaproteobacteria bacterium]
MLKIVLDANVFVSSLLTKTGRSAMVLDAWRAGRYLLVTSRSIISEIERVLSANHFQDKYGLSRMHIEGLVLLLENDAMVVPGLSPVAGTIPVDPADEMFLAAALDARADLIVSGDHHLLDLGEYKNTPISTVRGFLELLEKDQEPEG